MVWWCDCVHTKLQQIPGSWASNGTAKPEIIDVNAVVVDDGDDGMPNVVADREY